MNSLKINLNIGSIIKIFNRDDNTSQAAEEIIGVIINKNKANNVLICFNLNSQNQPFFYQVNLENSNYELINNKNINHPDFFNIKKALLKYYHLHKHNKDEVKVLMDIMDFAYPNGIPNIQDKSTHVAEYEKENEQFLEAGTQVKLKCHPNSTVSFLDNQVLDIQDFLEKGIRVVKRGATNESNKYYTLFYKHPTQDKSLAGVHEMIILPNNPKSKGVSVKDQLQMKLEKETDKSKGFLTQIMDVKGNVFELNSSTLELNSLDGKMKGNYVPRTDEINIVVNMLLEEQKKKTAQIVKSVLSDDDDNFDDEEDVNVSVIKINDSDDECDGSSIKQLQSPSQSQIILPVSLPIQSKFSTHIENQLDNETEESSGEDDDDILAIKNSLSSNQNLEEVSLKGGAYKKTRTKTEDLTFESMIELDMIDEETEELIGLKSRIRKIDDDDLKTGSSGLDTGSGSGSEEYELEDFDIADEPIEFELSKVIYRSKKVLVPDEKKIYQPEIQKSEFFKYLLEKYIPNKQLRKNNFLVNQVHKINNRIVDLKNEFVSLKDKLNNDKNKDKDFNLEKEKEKELEFEQEQDADNEEDDEEERTNKEQNREDRLIFNKGHKPILEAYLKNDYRNKFLIPIVLDRKKLYFPNAVTDYHYEFYSQNSNILYKNNKQVINDLNNLIEQKDSSKISTITYFQLEKAINEMLKPYKINDDSKIIGFIGNNADKIPATDLPYADFTGLVVRYNKSPFKSQGVDFQDVEIEGHSIKPPLIYYMDRYKKTIDDEIEEDDEDELMIEDVENQWMYEEAMESDINSLPNIKKLQDGDRFNIIGYLALPLKHAFNAHQIYYDSLGGLYDDYQNTSGVGEKEIDLESDSKNILDERDKPMFYYYPEHQNNGIINMQQNQNSHSSYLNKLIPDFTEICRNHIKELKKSNNWSDLEKIIEKYGYNLRYLNVEDWKVLSDILDEHLESHTYSLSKKWLDYQKYLQHELPINKPSARHFPLIDKMMLEGLENYYDTYSSNNLSVDSDTTRLTWAIQKKDNGKLLELLLLKNQLMEDEKNINKGELERSIAKKKQDLEILEGRYKKELQMSTYYNDKAKDECRDKPKYQVAKNYQTIKDLVNDNNIIAKTLIGNMDIKKGQYATVKENKKVYLRVELPNQKQVWEETKINLEQLEELVKQDCNSPAFDNLKELVKGDNCQYQKDDNKCYPAHLDRIYREINSHKKILLVLEAELEEISKIEIKKRKLETEISKAKSFLSSQKNLENLEYENKLQAYKQIIEDVEKAKNHVKDCPHFQVLNYFMRMKHITQQDKFTLSNMILQKFQDISPNFLRDISVDKDKDIYKDKIDVNAKIDERTDKTDKSRTEAFTEKDIKYIKDVEYHLKDYGRFDIVNPNLDFNWTYCSLCHQKLICNHYLYANYLIQETGELDETKLKDLYGFEVDQNYNCKTCGEFLVSGEDIDMDGFVKNAGKGDTRMVTREVIDQQAERQVIRQSILDDLLDNVETKNDEESKDMKLFLTTIQTLKSLTRVNLLKEDEEDIISYITSQQFLTREYFIQYLKKTTPQQQQQNLNQKLIEYQAEQFYYRFAVCDITARFLITLQTSQMTYSLSNDVCKGHLGGFPLGDINDLTTARYFICLLQKMGGLNEFLFLSKEANLENRFIGRLKLLAQTQNIQIKYRKAIEIKTSQIIYEDPFANHQTNFWIGFRPLLNALNLHESNILPTHLLVADKIHKIVVSKYDQFKTDLRLTLSYLSDKILENLYNIISKENATVSFPKVIKLGNSCCLTQLKSQENSTTSAYYDFIFRKEPHLKEIIKNLRDLDKIKLLIDRKMWVVSPPPSFMKVDNIFRIDPYFLLNQDFKMTKEFTQKLFELYIDSGINVGAPRIFNSFDICTLSGQSKKEIIEKEYNQGDYNDLINNIQIKGKIQTIKPQELNQQTILTKNIEQFLKVNKGINKDDFIYGFLLKFKNLINDEDIDIDVKKNKNKNINFEMSGTDTDTELTDKDKTDKTDKSDSESSETFKNKIKIKVDKKDKSREIEKHWSKLELQINQEVDLLVSHLSSVKKEQDFKNKIFKLGDYNKIYQEDDMQQANLNKDRTTKNKKWDSSSSSLSLSKEEEEDETNSMFKEASNKRHIRIEKNLKHYFNNFFRSSLSIIKNNAFDKYRTFDMNVQWKYLVYYRDYQPLFKKAYDLFDSMTKDLDLFNGSNYKYFTYQNSNKLLKCILLIVLNRMIEQEPHKNKDKNKKDKKQNTKMSQEDIELNLNFENEIKTEKSEDDLRLHNLKVFSDQKIIILYISQVLDRIIREEEDFNQLTQNYMTTVNTRKLEERNRKNLNIIATLAQDGRKDLRKVIMDQKRLGLISYEDFGDILAKEIDAGEDISEFDRDMELINDLRENEDISGDLIEEKIKEKIYEREVEEEYSYVPGEDEDYDDF